MDRKFHVAISGWTGIGVRQFWLHGRINIGYTKRGPTLQSIRAPTDRSSVPLQDNSAFHLIKQLLRVILSPLGLVGSNYLNCLGRPIGKESIWKWGGGGRGINLKCRTNLFLSRTGNLFDMEYIHGENSFPFILFQEKDRLLKLDWSAYLKSFRKSHTFTLKVSFKEMFAVGPGLTRHI